MLRMMLLIAGLFVALPVIVTPVQAAEIEAVMLAERINVDGNTLLLNGAGVRSKFFFDIYVGALYLPEKVQQAAHVLLFPAPARVSMTILYKEVAAEKLIHGWQRGFEKNQDDASMQALQDRLRAFNAMFGDAQRGDVLVFDFLSDGSTRVIINNKQKSEIPGVDFQRALLSVWLGENPADDDLKQALLGR
ncbi:MAG: chalcone isomerase family protein [Mariprofundaceae bacterium]|nr:chalcone isomerase family protein [Mariprofundaceae bacterium]